MAIGKHDILGSSERYMQRVRAQERRDARKQADILTDKLRRPSNYTAEQWRMYVLTYWRGVYDGHLSAVRAKRL